MELSTLYEGKIVRVYLDSGTILTGRAHFHDDEWLTLIKHDGKEASANLRHVVSIQKSEK